MITWKNVNKLLGSCYHCKSIELSLSTGEEGKMELDTQRINTDAIVVGAGASGVVAAKCLKEAGHEVLLLEKTSDIGGLWTFREDECGVMSFTRS